MGLGTKWVLIVLVLSGVLPVPAGTVGARRAPAVVVIGPDGLSVDGVAKARTPRLHELMRRGAWTLEARGVMPTLSSPNWESAIGGAGPEQHGVTSNGYFRRLVEFQPLCRDSQGRLPTIFGVLREQRPQSRIAVSTIGEASPAWSGKALPTWCGTNPAHRAPCARPSSIGTQPARAAVHSPG